MKKITLIFLTLLLCISSLFSQKNKSAFDINKRLGRGINIGNTFEAPSENAWGNPWNPEYFKIIADLGFTHVRLPVRWEPADRSMANAPYTILPAFMKRIQSVIDEALKNKLHIIINMHHHEALLDNPSGQKARFLSQWEQIASYFRNYPDSLLFEILNEPNDKLTPALWNQLAAEALSKIRETNPSRGVLVGTAEWGGISGLNQLQLPDDENLIVTIHYYNPFEFTHQGADWSNMEHVKDVIWYDSEAERETIHQEFEIVKQYSQTNQVPVHIGEFGAYSKADMDSRARWTTYLARWFEEQGFSWAYWEFSAGFGIYNPSAKQLSTPLVNALLHNPIPKPAKVELTSVYESDFKNNTDGWYVNSQGGAAATAFARDGKLETSVTAKGSEGWHVQLVKSNIPLEKNQMYRISFSASSTNPFSGTCYLGRNADPWSAYSDYHQVSLANNETDYSFVFTMKEVTDPAARFVFDLGNANVPASIRFGNICLEKMRIIPTGIAEIEKKEGIRYYFNQSYTTLYLINENNYLKTNLFSLNGNLVSTFNLTDGVNEINTEQWPAGIYLIYLKGRNKAATFKVLKSQ